MAEPSWANAAERNRQNPVAAPNPSELAGDPQLDVPKLPAQASPASNPALNRSAETVGRRLGNAVAGIDKLRSRIHLVAGQQAAAATSHIKEAARETAAEWRDAAEETAEELKQRVEPYINAATERTNQRVDELQQEAQRRINSLRRSAQNWVDQGRVMANERPLVVIGACAGACFLLGIALRVRRSNCD